MANVPSKTRRKIEWLVRRAEGALLPQSILDLEGLHLDWPDAMRRLADAKDELVQMGLEARFDSLGRAVESALPMERSSYAEQFGVGGVRRFHTSSGARI